MKPITLLLAIVLSTHLFGQIQFKMPLSGTGTIRAGNGVGITQMGTSTWRLDLQIPDSLTTVLASLRSQQSAIALRPTLATVNGLLAGYATAAQLTTVQGLIPTNNNQLSNGAGYLLSAALAPYETAATASGKYATQAGLATTNSNVTTAQTAATNALNTANGNTATITGHTVAITRDSTALVAQKKSADSLLTAFIALKTTATANTTAITNVTAIANTAVQNKYLSTGKDSSIVGSSNAQIVAFGAGGTSFPAGTLDSTKAIFYHHDGYYVGAGTTVATLATVSYTLKLGNSSTIDLSNVTLAALLLGTIRNITIEGNITFVRSGANFLPLFTGFIDYETATQFTYQKRKYVALTGTAFNPTVTNDFSVNASISNATLVMKPAIINRYTPVQ